MGFFRRTHVWGQSPRTYELRVDSPVARGYIHPFQGQEDPRTLVMRPIVGSDHMRVDAVRRANYQWLEPWEATLPPENNQPFTSMAAFIRRSDRLQARSQALFMQVQLDEEIVGQFSLSNVQWDAACMGSLGYWISAKVAGRGIGASCAAMMMDLALGELGLHRVEVCVRPENVRSLELCRRIGLIREGLRPRYLHIAGQWADHVAWYADQESMPEGGYVMALMRARGFA
ncbi:GNAT family N-acetyltransferase [Schaalia sp. lx-100]|uniref:GNAT family N-acetyltransferase n=1 Tax=Schaalia sp. lx-100 TaxID=2899081 RepID=UPI001E49DFA7|nr:GNAT family protein [Schaalia sp. lx-100]MCD4557625.1 GNAT family N-acetyltransferase [Schaalia sp. lx-100]